MGFPREVDGVGILFNLPELQPYELLPTPIGVYKFRLYPPLEDQIQSAMWLP